MKVKRNHKLKDFYLVFIYIGILLFSILFTSVYYLNSHGLRDLHMTLLFLPSLVSIFFLLIFAYFAKTPKGIVIYSFNIGFGLLWCYLCLTGIYNMAKSNSNWLWLFLLFSIFSFILSVALYLVDLTKRLKS